MTQTPFQLLGQGVKTIGKKIKKGIESVGTSLGETLKKDQESREKAGKDFEQRKKDEKEGLYTISKRGRSTSDGYMRG